MPFLNPDNTEQERQIDGWNFTYPKPWQVKTSDRGTHKVWHGIWIRKGGFGMSGWQQQIMYVRMSPRGATVRGFYSLVDHNGNEVWYAFKPDPLRPEEVKQAFNERRPSGLVVQPYRLGWAAIRHALWATTEKIHEEKVHAAYPWGYLNRVLP